MEEHFVFPPDAWAHDQSRRQKTALLQADIRKAVKRSVVAGSSFDRFFPPTHPNATLSVTKERTQILLSFGKIRTRDFRTINSRCAGYLLVVVVFTLKTVPISTQYLLTSVLVRLTRTPPVVTG